MSRFGQSAVLRMRARSLHRSARNFALVAVSRSHRHRRLQSTQSNQRRAHAREPKYKQNNE